MSKWALKVLKTGKTSRGQWVLGELSDDIILYYGIINMDKEYQIKENELYDVKTIDVTQNSKNARLNIKIGL